MYRARPLRAHAAAWLLAPAMALAGATLPERPHPAYPADPDAAVPALPQPRPFADYHPYQPPALAPWTESNRAVGPDAAPVHHHPAPATDTPAPVPADPHAHHHHQEAE